MIYIDVNLDVFILLQCEYYFEDLNFSAIILII